MKKTLFIGLILGMFTISGFIGNELVAVQAEKQTATKMEVPTLPGPDCQAAFERKCYYGNPLIVLPGEIVDLLDTQRFCSAHPISCTVTECSARLSVMFGFLPGSPKSDSCLPAGYRGK